MSIKEWLEYINHTEGSEYTIYDCDETLMERYANFKTKHLQAKILAFRSELDNLDCSVGGTIIISPKDSFGGFEVKSYYDNFFNITSERHGKINN